jgi:hypothetical protein
MLRDIAEAWAEFLALRLSYVWFDGWQRFLDAAATAQKQIPGQ